MPASFSASSSSSGSSQHVNVFVAFLDDHINAVPVCGVALFSLRLGGDGSVFVTMLQQLPLDVFDECVESVRVDPAHRLVFASTGSNSVVVGFGGDTPVLVWEQKTQFDVIFKEQLTEVVNIGCCFVGNDSEVGRRICAGDQAEVLGRETGKGDPATIILCFSSKDFSWTWQTRILITSIDTYHPSTSTSTRETDLQVLSIPKKVDLRIIDCSYAVPILVGMFGNSVSVLSRTTSSDFPGPMYPSGFKIMKDVRSYVEQEDELDTVVLNAPGTIPDSESAKSTDVDIIGGGSAVISGLCTGDAVLRRLPFDLFLTGAAGDGLDALKKRKMFSWEGDKADGDAGEARSDNVRSGERVYLEYIIPIPRSVKMGQFNEKVVNEKKVCILASLLLIHKNYSSF